ncbi:hypothetical protein V8C34DRAFT_301690 [Trichoderma compactum]
MPPVPRPRNGNDNNKEFFDNDRQIFDNDTELSDSDMSPSDNGIDLYDNDKGLYGNDKDLWALAYTLSKEREGELMEGYERHVASLNNVSVATQSFSEPHNVERYVKALLEIRQREKIQISIMGHDITMREQIEKLAKFLLWSNSIVKSAVSTQPYAALAWSGVALLLPLLISGTKYNDSMLKGFSSINDMQFYWKSCEETYFKPSNMNMKLYQDLKSPLVKLYSSIIKYQARVICHLSKAQLSRAWQSMAGSDVWSDAITTIKELHDKCLHLVDRAHKDIIQNKMDDQLQEIQRSRTLHEAILQEIREKRQDSWERELLEDLSKMSGDYEGNKNTNPERVSGTCEWFLTDERFHNWRNSKSGDLLWVSAGPGSGKSVLSKSLIDERHLNPETTVTVLSSTITVSKSPRLIEHSLLSHRTYSHDLVQRTDELWRILLDCVESSPVPIICLLDALDECEEEGWVSLTKKLCDLYLNTNSSAPSKLKFLITSRPYDNLKMSFDRLTASPAYVHFDGDDKSGQIGQEINLFIDVKVDKIARSFSTDDRNKISERLKNMENRTYLWPHLTLKILETKLSAYGRLLDMEEFLSELPSAVSGAYEKILSRSQDDRKVDALLQLILAAERPLTLTEANYALTLALGDGFSSHEELQKNIWPQDRFKTTDMMAHEHPEVHTGTSTFKSPLSMSIGQYNFEVMEVLLSSNSEVWVSTSNVSAAVRSGSSTMLGLPLDKLRDDIMITEDIVEAAADSNYASDLITLLLENEATSLRSQNKY